MDTIKTANAETANTEVETAPATSRAIATTTPLPRAEASATPASWPR
jgi:hypothetical protein